MWKNKLQITTQVVGAFFALNVMCLAGPAVAGMMPKECDTFCSGNGTHPLCTALKEEAAADKGNVLSDDSPEIVAETGLPKECQTFCSSPSGAGHALCAGAEKVAETTTNTGGSGLMVNEDFDKKPKGDDESVASRISEQQAAEAAALGEKTKEVVKAVEKRIKTAEQLEEERREEARRRRYSERGESEKRKKMGEHGVEMED